MTKNDSWISIQEIQDHSDDFSKAVFSLIGLLNYVIDERPAIGIDREFELRDQVALAMRFNQIISDPEERAIASKLVRKNGDVFKTIKIMRARKIRKLK
jgi:hypothetical protein